MIGLLPVEPALPVEAPPPDMTKPVELRMVRTATLSINAQDGGKMLAVNKYVANGGTIDGVVTRLQRYPDGSVLVTVRKGIKTGEPGSGTNRYIIIQGELDAEVLG